jgi:hypothetical protein
MSDEQEVRKKNMLDVQKDIFAQALATKPTRPFNRNKPLKDLVKKYRDALGDCNEEIPYNLQRFGLPSSLTYSALIYKVTWDRK